MTLKLPPETFEYDLVIVEPGVSMDGPGASQLAISAEVIDHQGSVARRSGKNIRLGMKVADAMRLLALLKAVQQQFGLAEAPPVQVIRVPPAKDRN